MTLKPPHRKTYVFILYLLITVPLLFLLLEVILRQFDFIPATVVRPQFYQNLLGDYQPNIKMKDTLSKEIKYTFTTNSQGFRSLREFDTKKT